MPLKHACFVNYRLLVQQLMQTLFYACFLGISQAP